MRIVFYYSFNLLVEVKLIVFVNLILKKLNISGLKPIINLPSLAEILEF